MKRKIVSLTKQLVMLLIIIFAVNFWQSRDLPSDKAPPLVTQTIEGGASDLTKIKPAQILFLYFFAPWCGVCKLSMGNLNTLQNWFPEISVHAVALDYETKDEVQKFVNDLGIKVHVNFGDSLIRDSWRIPAYPTYMVIGRDGNIHGASVGYSSQFGMILRVLWTKIID